MENWQEINDETAKKMLQEIYENCYNDDLIDKYSEAIEKKYKKPSGTISDFVFWSDLTIEEIMEKLKIDDVTYL